MTKNSYTEENIFRDKRINGIIDLMFTKLVEQFPATEEDTDNDFVFKGIILSGKASKILQEAGREEVESIIFETDKPEILTYLKLNYKKIFGCKGISFKERLLIYPQEIYLEIWPSETLVLMPANRIWIQNIANIPEIML